MGKTIYKTDEERIAAQRESLRKYRAKVKDKLLAWQRDYDRAHAEERKSRNQLKKYIKELSNIEV